jgi:transcriptional regulator with XRE-family HTH domain
MEYSYELLLEQLGARLKELRKSRGWTLRDMVVKHGFHLTHWQAFEKGNRGMSLPSLLRVAAIFDKTPSQLLEGLGEAPKSAAMTVPKPIRKTASKRPTSRKIS